MYRWLVIAMISMVVAHGALAQKLYRCGNTFSQTSCGSDAQEVKAAGVPQPVATGTLADLTPERHAEVKAQCERALREIPAWKDPESVRISTPQRARRSNVLTTADGRRAVVQWHAAVNAKNSYGGYTGESVANCSFDLTETSLVDVYVPRK